VIKPTIEAELGRPLAEVFSFVEPVPLGCASIGQAHRAVLAATGARVVVKVQDPSAERFFRGDVAALKALCQAFQPQAVPAFNEMEKQFASEFDYRLEAANGAKVAANLAQASFPNVVVPRVYPELCTKRVLVMQEVYPAVPLTRALEQQAAAAATHAGFQGTAGEYVAAEAARSAAEVAAAAARGEVAQAADATSLGRFIALQRARQGLYSALHAALGWVAPAAWWRSRVKAEVFVPMNVAKLVDDLLAVHGHEILVDGCFK
jgi:aarF domain-containing kinase